MLFAAFTPDKEPMQWAELLPAFQSWLHSAGGVATLALIFLALAALLRRHRGEQAVPLQILFLGLGLSLVLYAVGGTALMAGRRLYVAGYPLTSIGGLIALIALLIPMGMGVSRMRFGRIWALARLAFKEAIRSRVVLIFSLMALVFLFYPFFADYNHKPEDQLKNFVTIIFWSMMPLFLITASILGAFNIPNDIKNQSIHTIVTKPVEKLEIVVGRFLGFAGILSIGLLVLTILSYGYILRGVAPEAAKESFKARVPIFGKLYFFGEHKKQFKLENVGREWDYRSYIHGPHPSKMDAPKNFAFWEFDELPSSLEDMEWVPFEFTFDIFRLQKGKEGVPISCTFAFADGTKTFPEEIKITPIEQLHNAAQQERNSQRERKKVGLTAEEEKKRVDEMIIDKYAFFEVGGQPITDYHTLSVKVPGTLFKKLRENQAARPEAERGKPALVVAVNVDSTALSQMVGVARHDLYILAAERSFMLNFFKGVIGMWLFYLLVLGIAIACSTYLSGVISWLTTLFLIGTGLFINDVAELASGRAIGGGPFEAFNRLLERRSIGTPPDDTPLSTFIIGADDVYRWWLQLFMNIIPDVNRFDLIGYVANGFDISWGQVLFLDNFLYLLGYLIPWVILAYYLLKVREIANPT